MTNPNIPEWQIENVIEHEAFHVYPDSGLTTCTLTLINGYKVSGKSLCNNPISFREEVGRKLARDDARSKIYQLESYLSQQRHYENP